MIDKYRIVSLLQNSNINVSELPIPKAAIFVPMIENSAGISILFQVRSLNLTWQPGDICFPGGKIELTDISPRAAALRETQEELGLSCNDLVTYTELPPFIANLGLQIYPIIGEIIQPDNIQINSEEVEKVFTVPLSYLMTHQPKIATMQFASKPDPNFPFDLLPNQPKDWRIRSTHNVLFYTYKEYVIWGLTAQILKSVLDIIR